MLLSSIGARAAQMAYEGFDYASGSSNLSGQAGGAGWNGVWMTVNNGSADVQSSGLAASGNAPLDYDLRSIGRSCSLPNNRRIGRKLDTSAAGPFGSRGFVDGNGRVGMDGKTVYLSFMQQPNGTTAYYEFEFHRGDLGDPGRIGGIGNDQGGNNVNLRAPNGTHTFIAAGDANVNFYVVRIDFKAGNDDVFVYRNPTSLTEPGVPTLTKLNAADMSFDGVSFGAFNNGRTVAHDEVRIGESWTDVTIPAVAQASFVKQPKSSTTGFEGASVTLSTIVEGQPVPTLQWYKGTTLLSGKTASSLTLSNLSLTDTGDYHLEATNSQGTVSSNVAHVEVETAPSGLLAYDGFDYDTGLGALATKAGGIGWGAAWTNVNGGGGSVISASLAASTNAPNGYDNESNGNSSHIPNAQRDGRLLDTSLGGRLGSAGYIDGNGNVGADGKTLYLSFLQQPDGTTLFYEFEFHRGNLGDPGRIAGIGNDTNNPTVSLRAPNNTQSLIGPGSTGVNFYVVRIDFKAGNDDVYVYQNPVSATEPATATLIKLNAADMSFNGLSLAAFVGTRTVKHDEIRLGQSWSDVVFGTSRRNLVWVGDGALNEWNFSNSNWNDGIGATAFIDGDPVTFDDTGSNAPAVNVTTNVSTASLIVNNSANPYSIGGTATITSSGGLTKSGAESLVLTAPASFGSTITVNGGNLSLDGSSTVAGNLQLNAGAGDLTLSGANNLSGSMLDIGFGTRAFSGTTNLNGLTTTSSTITFSGTTNFTGNGAVIWFGNLSGANTTVTIEPGAVINITGNYNDALVFGRDGGNATVTQNGGTLTYNPSNRNEAFIGASTSNTGTNPVYNMIGGTFDMSNKRLGIALGGSGAGVTASFNQAGGNVLVRQLDIGANLTFGSGTYNLEGGGLTVGDGGITSTNALYTVNLGGGAVGAAASWASNLAMHLTGTGGDTTIDTSSHTITLGGALDGAGGLIKTGTGTLLLNSINTFSGATSVQVGTLGGLGNSDNSDLTVSSGAAIAPGSTGTGSFFCKSAAFSAGSMLALEINSSTTSADQLVSTGDVSLSGANLSLTEIGSGSILAGTELIIVDAAGNLTGTFAGYAEAAPLSVGANTFTIHYTTTQVKLISTTVPNPYLDWAASKGLDGSPGKDPAFDSDPEGDGLANGLEWILGGDPLAEDGASLVTMTGDGNTGLTLSFNRDEASIGAANLIVQWSADLGTWTDVPVEQAGGSYPNGVTVTVDEIPAPDAVTVFIPASNGLDGRLFARLKAIAP